MADEKQELVELSRQQHSRITIISQLYKRGYSTSEIRNEVAKRLDCKYDLRTCRTDIAVMLKEWKESRLGNIDDVISLELARIDEMTREAWVAWERSKENSKKTVQRQKAMPNDEEGGKPDDVSIISMEQEQVEESQVGDPRFLQLINQLSAERRKILGLYAPERHEITGADGGAIETKFTGFSFLPWTDGLANSEQTKIASGEEIKELPVPEPEERVVDYAEIVSIEDVKQRKQETAGGL